MTTNERIAAIAAVTGGLQGGLHYAPFHKDWGVWVRCTGVGEFPTTRRIIPDDIAHAAIRDYWRERIENGGKTATMIKDGRRGLEAWRITGHDNATIYTTENIEHSDKTIALGILLCKVLNIPDPEGVA